MGKSSHLILSLGNRKHKMICFKRSGSQLWILAFRATTVRSLHMGKQGLVKLIQYKGRIRPMMVPMGQNKIKEVCFLGNLNISLGKFERSMPSTDSKRVEEMRAPAFKRHELL
jgi:hypothetical protein